MNVANFSKGVKVGNGGLASGKAVSVNLVRRVDDSLARTTTMAIVSASNMETKFFNRAQ